MSNPVQRQSRRARFGPLALVALGLLVGPDLASAQVNFEEHVISDDEDGANAVHAADVDGDGDTDVLSASSFEDDQIAWYENDGGAPPLFTERIISEAGLSPQSLFATDLDGDGDTDVLSSWESDLVMWHENEGGSPPEFKDRLISTTAEMPASVFATDLDGDGDMDALSANGGGDRVVWYENDGALPPAFLARTVSTTLGTPLAVFATDVDGDGDNDVLSASFFDKVVAWFENDGGSPPEFIERIVSTTTGTNGVTSVFATDMDGDGDTDLLTAGGQVVWFENDGGSPPAFTARIIAVTPFGGFDSVYATDVDEDGDTDVLLASNAFDPVVSLVWYENFGDEIPCADIETLSARCDFSGTINVRLTLTNSSHDGESVTLGVDGVPHVRTINGAAATYVEPSAAPGAHLITLDDPAACLAPIIEQCPLSSVSGSVAGMSGDRVVCLNETTGQSVELSDTTLWDCEAAGLVVNPGDKIRQTVVGDSN